MPIPGEPSLYSFPLTSISLRLSSVLNPVGRFGDPARSISITTKAIQIFIIVGLSRSQSTGPWLDAVAAGSLCLAGTGTLPCVTKKYFVQAAKVFQLFLRC